MKPPHIDLNLRVLFRIGELP